MNETIAQQTYERARRWIPTGTSSNSRIRQPHPIYGAAAHGAELTTVDGARLVDFMMGNGSIILGHCDSAVTDAVTTAVANGLTTGIETPDAVKTAELMAEMVPDFGAVRFANTGTEAILHGLQIARAATGKPRIAKPEASYHGWLDQVWVSTWPPIEQAGSADTPTSVPGSAGLDAVSRSTLVLPFNDVAGSVKLIEENADSLAAVILEPVMIDIGYVPADQGYVDALREVTTRRGVLLIFDELLTGFRVVPGGARERFAVHPDLTMYGKAIANGYPLAALEGRRELMDLTDPTAGGSVGWVGTFNAHAVSVAASRAAMTKLRDGTVHARLRGLAAELTESVERVARDTRTDVVCCGEGGHFQIYFASAAPRTYRDAQASATGRYKHFATECARSGLMVAGNPLGHNALSAAHTSDHISELAAALRRSITA